MDAYMYALLLYGGGCVLACWLMREDDAGEMLKRYGILTRYQRVKEWASKLLN